MGQRPEHLKGLGGLYTTMTPGEKATIEIDGKILEVYYVRRNGGNSAVQLQFVGPKDFKIITPYGKKKLGM